MRFTDVIASEGKWLLLPFLITVGIGKRGAEGKAQENLVDQAYSMLRKRPF